MSASWSDQVDAYVKRIQAFVEKVDKALEEDDIPVWITVSNSGLLRVKEGKSAAYERLQDVFNNKFKFKCLTCGDKHNIFTFQNAHLRDKSAGGTRTIPLCANCNQVQNRFKIKTVSKLYLLINK